MALIHLAKGAGTGTGRPHEQKGCRFLGVALASIWAAPLFADGVNLPLFDDLLHRGYVAGVANGATQPFWHGLKH